MHVNSGTKVKWVSNNYSVIKILSTLNIFISDFSIVLREKEREICDGDLKIRDYCTICFEYQSESNIFF